MKRGMSFPIVMGLMALGIVIGVIVMITTETDRLLIDNNIDKKPIFD